MAGEEVDGLGLEVEGVGEELDDGGVGLAGGWGGGDGDFEAVAEPADDAGAGGAGDDFEFEAGGHGWFSSTGSGSGWSSYSTAFSVVCSGDAAATRRWRRASVMPMELAWVVNAMEYTLWSVWQVVAGVLVMMRRCELKVV